MEFLQQLDEKLARARAGQAVFISGEKLSAAWIEHYTEFWNGKMGALGEYLDRISEVRNDKGRPCASYARRGMPMN